MIPLPAPFSALCCGEEPSRTPSLGTPRKIDLPGVENSFQLSEKLYSGGEPKGDQAFAALRKLGIQTIVSVDGARPDLETAKKYGLQYVHIPIGYDRVKPDRMGKMAKAVQGSTGPVFVHCHHGRHRGPAAAALVCMTLEGWTPARALEWLKTAKTSPEYAGLFDSVRQLKPPSLEDLQRLRTDLPEVETVSPMIDTMVTIDRLLELIKRRVKESETSYSGASQPPDSKDSGKDARAAVRRTSLLLKEHFRELARTEDARGRGKDFLELLSGAEEQSWRLHEGLREDGFFTSKEDPRQNSPFQSGLQSLEKTCTACHKRFRD